MQPKTLGAFPGIAFSRPQFDPLRVPEPRLGDGKTCFILRNRVGREGFLFEQDPPAEGGGGGDKPKTFTQEEHQAAVNAAIGKRLGEEKTKYEAEKRTLSEKLADMERAQTELQEKLDSVGKTKDELERDNAAKAAKQIEKAAKESKERETLLSTERDGWKGKYIGREVADQLGRSLDAAKVLGSARADAILGLRTSAEIVHDDEGRITSITYEGVAYDTVDKAAAAYLKMKPFFASAGTGGGGGTKPPNGNGAAAGGRALHEMSDEELHAMDTRRRSAAGR